MVKQCLYCGQPLPEEDARFCNSCGRAQFLSSAGSAGMPAPIRVKLPPKEYVRDELSSMRPEGSQPGRLPERVRPFQPEQPSQMSSRLPRRPGRLTTQETQAGGGKSGMAKNSSPVPARPAASTPAKTSRPAPAEEESTMVLPGWQEELERLRKERLASSSLPPKKKEDDLAQGLPAASQGSQDAPAEQKSETPAPSERAREKTPSDGFPANRPPRPARRPIDFHHQELRAKVWEQEPTLQLPQAYEEKQKSGPAPDSEQMPFAEVSLDQEKQDRPVADLATARWQAPLPATTQDEEDSEPIESTRSEALSTKAKAKDESGALVEREYSGDAFPKVEKKDESGAPVERRRPDAVSAKAEAKDEVEDLPTVPLAVPQVAKNAPEITIERTSTPAPRNTSAPATEDDIENLPTRKMPAASPARPRSPRPPAQLESKFDPTSMPPLPHNPASLPGDAAPWSETSPPQRPPSFTPVSPLPNTPRPEPEALAAARAKAPAKKRASGKLVAVLVVLLLVCGGGGFLVYYQLSSGGSILQPQQSYQITALGVSLSYPQHWSAGVDQAHNTVHFADSSQTGQINLSRAETNGRTLTQYLNQETTQLGITAPQSVPAITFAGTSWQQVRGNVTQKGATYTIVLYVTQHNGYFYALSCLSPLAVYAQMETDDFAPLRASFTFL